MSFTRLTSDKLAQITGGHWHRQPPAHFTMLSTDTRTIADGGLFVALTEGQTDGHDHLEQLNPDQHQAALVERQTEHPIAQLVTPDTAEALQAIARHIAQNITAQKLALTGSFGKTGTKEMLAVMLAAAGPTHANKGNYNNHIGLPLTLADMPENTAFLVTEMGMNHSGEISRLSQLVQPHITGITCISDAHRGHFSSVEDIAHAKAEIFEGLRGDGIAVLPRDDEFFPTLKAAAQARGCHNIITFGTDQHSDIRLISATATDEGQNVRVRQRRDADSPDEMVFSLGMHAPHWALNSLCAAAMAFAAGVPFEVSFATLADMTDLPGRGRHIRLDVENTNVLLIDDSYNAGPRSLRASLEYFASRNERRKSLILSDMRELGSYSAEAHAELVQPVASTGASHFFAIGPEMSSVARSCGKKAHTNCFDDAQQMLSWMTSEEFSADMLGDAVLVKGSHGSGAWKIADHLAACYGATSDKAASSSQGAPDAA